MDSLRTDEQLLDSNDDDDEEQQQQDESDEETPPTPLSNTFNGSINIVSGGGEPPSKRPKTNIAHQINISGRQIVETPKLLGEEQQRLAVRTLWTQTDDLKNVGKRLGELRKKMLKEFDDLQTEVMAIVAAQQQEFQEHFHDARMEMRARQQLEQAQEQAKAARLQRTSLAESQFVPKKK